jgi:xanthine dehydrogenase large subunit
LTNELVAEAFADYRKNQAYRIDEVTEAKAHDQGAWASAASMSPHTCMWPARPPISTTCPSWKARCTARWGSPVAHGRLTALALEAVRAMPEVVDVITAADIPGVNDCGSIIHDDPIL